MRKRLIICASAVVVIATLFYIFTRNQPAGSVAFIGWTNVQGSKAALFTFPEVPTEAARHNFFFKKRYDVRLEALLMHDNGTSTTSLVKEINFASGSRPGVKPGTLDTRIVLPMPIPTSATSMTILKAEGTLMEHRDNSLHGLERLFNAKRIQWSFAVPHVGSVPAFVDVTGPAEAPK
jgi:hypothetical protein